MDTELLHRLLQEEVSTMLTKLPEANNKILEKQDKYYEQELSQVIDRFNSLENFRVQLGAFLGTANLTVLGIALSTQKTGIILIATVILLLFIAIDQRFRKLCVTYLVRGIQLQKKFAPDDNDTFIHILPSTIAEEAQDIAALQSSAARKRILKRSKSYFRSYYFLATLIVMIGEITVSLILWRVYGWILF